MSTFEQSCLNLARHVIINGEIHYSRAGVTSRCFGTQLHINCMREDQFPILTTRQMYPRGVFAELASFLTGSTSLSEYAKQGCNYWEDNAGAWLPNKYLSREKWKVGRIYGPQWRNWEGDEDFEGHDQIKVLIEGIKKEPSSRRHLLTSYNPAELHLGCLPPCHLLAQFSVSSGYLDCMVTMRSVDLCLGLPSDIVLYAALLILICHETGHKPGSIVFSMGDSHVYTNHVSMFAAQETREPLELPTWQIDADTTFDNFDLNSIRLINYKACAPITYKLNV